MEGLVVTGAGEINVAEELNRPRLYAHAHLAGIFDDDTAWDDLQKAIDENRREIRALEEGQE